MIGEAIVDRDIATLDKANLAQAPAEGRHEIGAEFRDAEVEEADHRHRLLCVRGERRRSYRAANESDELASPHSITSSARTRRPVGTVMPSVSAVFKLMVRSNFVACSTGRSPGLSPLRMRPT